MYGTLSGSNTYHAARGNTDWVDGDDELKTQALVRASAYIDSLGLRRLDGGNVVNLWPGTKTGGRAQPAAWPRTGAVDSDGDNIDSDTVPVEVEYATYEAALRELTAPGSLAPDYVASSLVKREKVGPIEVEYAAAAAAGGGTPTQPILPAVLALLAPLLSSNYSGPYLVVV